MIVVDTVTTSIPKSLRFSLEEVQLILQLLYMKKKYSGKRELLLVESLINGFTSLKIELEEEERYKAGLS